jgi:NAD(P)H-hydrate epimerase
VEYYITKSDSVLIGPGLMRHGREDEGKETREITRDLLLKFPNKKWVIDGGSLQVMEPEWIPKNSILTPNKKEYELLFKNMDIESAAKKYECVIVLKGPTTIVCSPNKTVEVYGGNAGLTKGGTGDCEAGLTVALMAKNHPFLAATIGSYVTKLAADTLFKKVGFNYNSDDLANEIPQILR